MGNINSCSKKLEWWLKVVEFILGLLIFIAWAAYPIYLFNEFTFAFLCCGYWVIFLGFILTMLFDSDHKFLEKYFCVVGCIVFLWLFVVSLLGMFVDNRRYDYGYYHNRKSSTENIVMTILAAAESAILIWDTIIQFKK